MNYLNATPRVEVEPPNPQANNLHSVYTVNEIDSKLEQIRNEVSAHKLAHSKEIYFDYLFDETKGFVELELIF